MSRQRSGQRIFVRQHLIEPAPPPPNEHGIFQWLRRNLFATKRDGVVSLILIAVSFILVSSSLDWLIFSAVWSGEDRQVCATIAQGGIRAENWSGACWAFIRANFQQILYGSYDLAERWRVNLLAVVVILVNIPLLAPSLISSQRHKFLNICLSIIIVPLIGWLLLSGGLFGLKEVGTQKWGGLMVTLIITYLSISISLPLGTLLALGRRSKMYILSSFCIAFIETLRGVPLVAVLFIANVMFPLFLPGDMVIDKFVRALVAVALFTSAYIAEVIRGGLQAVPESQYEAARALGLGHASTILLVILPQAYRLVVPAIVNTLIGMFKDTSLVYIISMYDLLGIIRTVSLQAKWITPQTPATAFMFAGIIYWIFCFAMSHYGRYIERYMNRPHHK